VSETKLQKSVPSAIKEKGQYILALGVVASMLVVAGFPVFVVFFFGVFAFFLFKMFSSGSRSEIREVFEFYLSANEILKDDDRRWFGFEINEAIGRGEGIIHQMSAAPPLVHYALGALYNKNGDHKSAVKYLAHVLENENSLESAFVYPTTELRNYVKILRKIEREPADAPLTSAAIRSLERSRKIRGAQLLEESRTKFATSEPKRNLALEESVSGEAEFTGSVTDEMADGGSFSNSHPAGGRGYSDATARTNGDKKKADPFADRKPITEVLHDIYDRRRG
jgi:hypothetical protein